MAASVAHGVAHGAAEAMAYTTTKSGATPPGQPLSYEEFEFQLYRSSIHSWVLPIIIFFSAMPLMDSYGSWTFRALCTFVILQSLALIHFCKRGNAKMVRWIFLVYGLCQISMYALWLSGTSETPPVVIRGDLLTHIYRQVPQLVIGMTDKSMAFFVAFELLLFASNAVFSAYIVPLRWPLAMGKSALYQALCLLGYSAVERRCKAAYLSYLSKCHAYQGPPGLGEQAGGDQADGGMLTAAGVEKMAGSTTTGGVGGEKRGQESPAHALPRAHCGAVEDDAALVGTQHHALLSADCGAHGAAEDNAALMGAQESPAHALSSADCGDHGPIEDDAALVGTQHHALLSAECGTHEAAEGNAALVGGQQAERASVRTAESTASVTERVLLPQQQQQQQQQQRQEQRTAESTAPVTERVLLPQQQEQQLTAEAGTSSKEAIRWAARAKRYVPQHIRRYQVHVKIHTHKSPENLPPGTVEGLGSWISSRFPGSMASNAAVRQGCILASFTWCSAEGPQESLLDKTSLLHDQGNAQLLLHQSIRTAVLLWLRTSDMVKTLDRSVPIDIQVAGHVAKCKWNAKRDVWEAGEVVECAFGSQAAVPTLCQSSAVPTAKPHAAKPQISTPTPVALMSPATAQCLGGQQQGQQQQLSAPIKYAGITDREQRSAAPHQQQQQQGHASPTPMPLTISLRNTSTRPLAGWGSAEARAAAEGAHARRSRDIGSPAYVSWGSAEARAASERAPARCSRDVGAPAYVSWGTEARTAAEGVHARSSRDRGAPARNSRDRGANTRVSLDAPDRRSSTAGAAAPDNKEGSGGTHLYLLARACSCFLPVAVRELSTTVDAGKQHVERQVEVTVQLPPHLANSSTPFALELELWEQHTCLASHPVLAVPTMLAGVARELEVWAASLGDAHARERALAQHAQPQLQQLLEGEQRAAWEGLLAYVQDLSDYILHCEGRLGRGQQTHEQVAVMDAVGADLQQHARDCAMHELAALLAASAAALEARRGAAQAQHPQRGSLPEALYHDHHQQQQQQQQQQLQQPFAEAPAAPGQNLAPRPLSDPQACSSDVIEQADHWAARVLRELACMKTMKTGGHLHTRSCPSSTPDEASEGAGDPENSGVTVRSAARSPVKVRPAPATHTQVPVCAKSGGGRTLSSRQISDSSSITASSVGGGGRPGMEEEPVWCGVEEAPQHGSGKAGAEVHRRSFLSTIVALFVLLLDSACSLWRKFWVARTPCTPSAYSGWPHKVGGDVPSAFQSSSPAHKKVL